MSAKYEFIDAEKANYPIVKMCAWAGVSTSGFYEWRDRPASATARRREELKLLIQAIFDDSDATYGYRRVHAALARQGERCSPELVRALMRQLGLQPCQPLPWRPTTTEAGDAGEIPDLVRRDFSADEPGAKLVGDITYIPTWEGWLYLATVLDCHTKACIGYALADHMRTDLVIEALEMAARNYSLAEDAIFHPDRGTQYTSEAFAKKTAELGIRRSVGRTGVCFDNAQAESFNAAVKVERVNRTVYPTREHARKDVTRYIEFRYNTKRLHSALGYRTPTRPTPSTLTATPQHEITTIQLSGKRWAPHRLKLFLLPGYSSELNPDEWVWKNVKHDRIARRGVTSKDDLTAKAIGALRRLQKLPHIVRGFFADPHLHYITAGA